MQQAFCKNHQYLEGCFGLTACDGPEGYKAYIAGNRGPIHEHDGTIAPPAILACLPFAETETINLFNTLKLKDLANDKFGICNAYNVLTGWKASDAIGIDLGSMLLMLDAYNKGTIHKLSDQSPVIRKILDRAGFRTSEKN